MILIGILLLVVLVCNVFTCGLWNKGSTDKQLVKAAAEVDSLEQYVAVAKQTLEGFSPESPLERPANVILSGASLKLNGAISRVEACAKDPLVRKNEVFLQRLNTVLTEAKLTCQQVDAKLQSVIRAEVRKPLAGQ